MGNHLAVTNVKSRGLKDPRNWGYGKRGTNWQHSATLNNVCTGTDSSPTKITEFTVSGSTTQYVSMDSIVGDPIQDFGNYHMLYLIVTGSTTVSNGVVNIYASRDAFNDVLNWNSTQVQDPTTPGQDTWMQAGGGLTAKNSGAWNRSHVQTGSGLQNGTYLGLAGTTGSSGMAQIMIHQPQASVYGGGAIGMTACILSSAKYDTTEIGIAQLHNQGSTGYNARVCDTIGLQCDNGWYFGDGTKGTLYGFMGAGNW